MKLRLLADNMVAFHCPGCDHLHAVHVGPDPDFPHTPMWGYNDDPVHPTLTPSILFSTEKWVPPVTPANVGQWRAKPWDQVKVPYVCHSFVTAGQIEFLTDCTHALAGQTVDLPDYP